MGVILLIIKQVIRFLKDTFPFENNGRPRPERAWRKMSVEESTISSTRPTLCLFTTFNWFEQGYINPVKIKFIVLSNNLRNDFTK